MSQVIITVHVDGQVKVDAQGYKGASCKESTAAIERALGTVSSDQKKPEFHQSAGQSAQRRHEQR